MEEHNQCAQFSKKVYHSQRDHHPAGIPQTNLHASMLKTHVNEDVVLGKKRFEPTYSLSEDFKPGCKMVSHQLVGSEAVARGRKYISAATGGAEIQPGGRKPSNLSQQRSDTTQLIKIGWTRKHNVKQVNGEPAHMRQSEEYNMEGYMNRKQRITSELQQRNNIPVAVPGDRPFRRADGEPGYYAKGGLIPGSSIQLRKSARPTFKKNETDAPTNTSNKNKKTLTMTYEQRQEMLERDYDRKQVEVLTNESLNFQGQAVPSWENRTGFFLVKPEDENY